MVKLLVIGIGGFLGAILRYGVSGWAYRLLGTGLPFGTLGVNVLGSFCLGVFLVVANERMVFSDLYRHFLAVGVLGAFTTFSTFSYETLALIQDNLVKPALLNVGLNLGLGLGAVWLGTVAARTL